MSEQQPPHPLDRIVQQLIDAVPDRNLRFWRGWLRGESEYGGDLRQRFNESGLTEPQIDFLWKLIFNVADYQMHMLMDFVENSTSVGRVTIEVYSEPQPSADDPDVPGPQTLENVIDTGDMFPGHYIGWSEKFMTVSDVWQVEQSIDPAAPRPPKPAPPAGAVKCSFCGWDEYPAEEVWASPLAECAICRSCAALSRMFLPPAEESGDEPAQADT